MIYQQTVLNYSLAVLVVIITAFRLSTFLNSFFSDNLSKVSSLVILFHPLSIDAFMAPNLVPGGLAFLFFIEAQLCLKNKNLFPAFIYFILSAACNFAYCLFPIYYFFINRHSMQKYKYLFILYTFLLGTFLSSHTLFGFHYPLTFFVNFIQNLVAPISPNIITYSLYPLLISSLIFSSMTLAALVWKLRLDSKIKAFFPMLFLPLGSLFFSPLSENYQFWHEFIFSPSSYLPITFAFIVLIAYSLPRKIYLSFVIFIFISSINWMSEWESLSNILKTSHANLPTTHKVKLLSINRLLVKLYLHEGKNRDAEELLFLLSSQYPNDPDLKSDLGKLKRPPLPSN